MRASLLIATYDRCEILRRTFPTVIRQRERTHDCEIIVVVSGGGDGTIRYLRSFLQAPWLRIVEQEPRGQPAALNEALRLAKGDVIIFLDDDLICQDGLLEAHLAAHAEGAGPFAVFGLTTSTGEGTSFVPAVLRDRLAAERRHRCMENGEETHLALGHANSSARRDVLLRHEGFDESFREARSDAELGVRVWKSGVKFKFEPRAIAQEILSKDLSSLENESRSYGRHEYRLCRLHPTYREHSPLMRWFRGPKRRQRVRQFAARCSLFPAWLFRSIYRIVSRGKPSGPALRIAMRAQTILLGLQYFRGALREAGDWDALRGEFAPQEPARAP